VTQGGGKIRKIGPASFGAARPVKGLKYCSNRRRIKGARVNCVLEKEEKREDTIPREDRIGRKINDGVREKEGSDRTSQGGHGGGRRSELTALGGREERPKQTAAERNDFGRESGYLDGACERPEERSTRSLGRGCLL